MAKIIGNTTATPNPKPDWNQNDETKADYIKNKPVYAAVEEVDYTRLPFKSNPACEVIPGPEGSGYVMVKGKKLGLVEGETYEVDLYVHSTENSIEDDTTYYYTETFTCEITTEVFYTTCGSLNFLTPEGISFLSDYWIFEVFDGVVFNDDGEIVPGDGYIYYTNDLFSSGEVYSFKINNLPSVDCIYHKLDSNFIDTDIVFNGDSLKPQSGQAVSTAMVRAIDRSSPNISETLGDGHIKKMYDYKTYKNYLYTEGIGLNADLKTANKETIVDAINEIIDKSSDTLYPWINNDNLLIYYDQWKDSDRGHHTKINLIKTSDEDIGDEPFKVFYSYNDFPHYNSSKYFYSSIYNGYVRLELFRKNNGETNGEIRRYTIDGHEYNYGYLNLPSIFTQHFNSCDKFCFLVLQEVETQKYYFNLLMYKNNTLLYQWDLYNKQYKTDNLSFYFGSSHSGPCLDSTRKYYSEFYGVWSTENIGVECIPLCLGEDGFITLDSPIQESEIYSNSWNGDANSVHLLTDLSNAGKMFKVTYKTSKYGQLKDDNNNIILDNCRYGLCKLNDTILAISLINDSWYLCIIDINTNNIISQINTTGLKSDFGVSDNMFVINNRLYIINSYSSYSAVLNENLISFDNYSFPSMRSFSKKAFKTMESRNNLVISFDNGVSDDGTSLPICFSSKKELKFNETDTDQTFNPESTLPQSGKAIAEVIKSGSQSDWNENNSFQNSFIKNKPFYKVEDRIYANKNVECKIAGEEHHSAGFLYEYQNFTDAYAFNLKEGQSYTMEIIDEERLAAPIIFENIKIQDIQEMVGADHPIMGIIAGDYSSRDNTFIYIINHNFNNGYIQYVEGGSAYSFGLIDKNNEYLTDGTVTVNFYQDFNGVTATEEYLPHLQPNWNENNSSSISYVQNRTHWKEEVAKNELVLYKYYTEDPRVPYFLGKRLGLVEGETYHIEYYMNNTFVRSNDLTAITNPTFPTGTVVITDVNNPDDFCLLDGVGVKNGEQVSAENCTYSIEAEDFNKVIISNFPHTEFVFHTVPDKYVDQKEVDYYLSKTDLAQLNRDTARSYMEISYDYPNDTSLDFDVILYCGAIKSDKTEGYFGLPVEGLDNQGAVLSDYFKNWDCFSNLSILSPSCLGERFVPVETIGKLLVTADYCTSQQTIVSPLDRTVAGVKCLGLMCRIKLTFASKEIRDTVLSQIISPTFNGATYYRLTYKKPNPQAEIGG